MPRTLAFTPGDDIAVVEEKLPLPSADEWAQAHAEARGDGWPSARPSSGRAGRPSSSFRR